MGIIIGVDIGGSATKIVGFTDNRLIGTMLIKAADPLTSVYGAFGRFVSAHKLSINKIESIIVTGVGSSYITEPMYGIRTYRVMEFNATGLGGLYLTKLDRAIVVSMGTGTAFIKARHDHFSHVGGSGVGGGMLIGLSGLILGARNFDTIVQMAETGDLSHIDLSVGDIMRGKLEGLPPDTTASNFGNVSDTASKEDLALGIVNLIFQSVGMMAIFVSRIDNDNDIVLTGNLSVITKMKTLFKMLERLHNVKFHIPEHSQYATAIGAAMSVSRGIDVEEIAI